MELNGMIREGDDYSEIMIGSEVLSECAEEFNGDIVKLNYYISNHPIMDRNDAVEKFLCNFYQGMSEADSMYISGTSWTGVYARNDDFEVGGHDIIEELRPHIGKYCFLIVEEDK